MMEETGEYKVTIVAEPIVAEPYDIGKRYSIHRDIASLTFPEGMINPDMRVYSHLIEKAFDIAIRMAEVEGKKITLTMSLEAKISDE